MLLGGIFAVRYRKASDFLVILKLAQNLLNPVYRVQQAADGGIVVQGINQQRNILAHIAADIVRTLQQVGLLIDKVGGDQLGHRRFPDHL